VDELPVARRIVEPAYPDLAREAQVEGLVVVRARVDSTGRVDQVEIERSVPLLDQAALDAARKFRFDPARVGRHPVAVWVQLPFRFKLH
jgi:protein TonB